MSKEEYEVKIRPEKIAIVDEMKEKLTSDGVVLISYNKLDVASAMKLRRTFLKHGVQYSVIKNTLTRIAADDLGIKGFHDLLKGPSGLATCKDDAVAPAAAIKEFLKETKSEAIQIKAGVLDGKLIDPKAVQALADLPSKEQLLGMVAATLLAPITGLARALNGNIQNLAYALEAVRKQKESA